MFKTKRLFIDVVYEVCVVMGTEAGTTDTEPAIGEADYYWSVSVEVSTKFRGRFHNV